MAATFSSTYSTTQVLSNPTTQNPATVTSTGRIDVNSPSAFARGILGTSGVAWTLTNLGTVESTGSQGIGINLQFGGLVVNGSSGSSTGYVDGTSSGIQISNLGTILATGTVANYGTIRAISTSSNSYGVFLYDLPLEIVINSGAITTGAFGGNATAVKLTGGGTIINSGIINAAYGSNEVGVAALYSSNTVIVLNSGTIQAAGTTPGIGIKLGVGSVNNSGLISGSSTGVTWQGYLGGPADPGTVVNSGTILATAANGSAINLYGGGSVSNNAGLIEAPLSGVNVSGAAGTVANSGTIEATTAANSSNTVILSNGGSVSNLGVISNAGHGIGAFAVQIGPNNPGNIVNGQSGSTAGLIAAYHIAIITGTAGGPSTVTNFGTIESTGIYNAISLRDGGSVLNGASGSIGGLITGAFQAIGVSGSAGTITNFATIAGASTGTTSGAAIVLNAGGVVSNGASGSTGGLITAAFEGIGIFNSAGTVVNYGTVVATNVVPTGTQGNGFGILNGTGVFLSGGGTITNLGTLSVPSADDGFAVTLTANGGRIINGRNGSGLGVINAYHLGIGFYPDGGAGTATIVNYGTIQSTQPAKATVTGFSGFAVAFGVGASGTIDNFGTISAAQTNGGGAIQLDAGGTGTNSGAGGAVINEAGASIIAGYTGLSVRGGRWTITNRGRIESTGNQGVYFEAGGSVNNSVAGVISGGVDGVDVLGSAGTAVSFGTVVNSGTIQSTGATIGAGVYFEQGGVLTNQASGLIVADRTGITVHGTAGTIKNFGTIVSLASTSFTAGAGVYLGGGGLIANEAAGLITALYDGVVLSGGGSLTNYGTITGSQVGAYLEPAGSVPGAGVLLTNFGLVAGATGIVDGGPTGILDTIVNYGTIAGTGGAGITLGRGTDRVVDFGTISGANGTALAFGGGSGLVVVEPGAVLAATLAGFGVLDTIDLAKVQATGTMFSGTTLAGTLSVLNGTAVVESLVLSGQFAGKAFALSPDGQGGVDINLRAPLGNVIPGTYGFPIILTGANASTTVTATGSIAASLGDGVVNAVGVVGTLTNMGRVTAAASGSDGVYFGAGGLVTNGVAGSAGGYISGAGAGVRIGGATGTVVNTGTITGGSGIVIDNATLTTITNAGTIIGTTGPAVSLGGGNNRLIVDPGAAFAGTLDGGGGASVLEIAALSGGSGGSGPGRGQGSVAYVSLGSVTNFSALQIDPSATLDGSGALSFATLINEGQVVVGSGDALALGDVAAAANTGVIDLRTGATVDFEGPVANQILAFNPAGGSAKIDQPAEFAGTIADFTASLDTIDLTSLVFAGNTSVGFTPATDALTVVQGGASATLQLDAEDYTGITWSAAPDAGSGTEIAANPCYCRGTLILTEQGEVAVEDLAIGDRVMTLSGMARPVKWIGRRSYDGRFALGQRHILPVCVKAGALADGVPRRDLWLSPNHALHLEGVLIEARDLINHVSVFQAERVAAIDYFHIELDSHDVILAEGAAAESFIDDDSRLLFHNAHEYRAIYPDGRNGPARYCAPRRDQGYAVERARTRIARRAGLAAAASAEVLRRRTAAASLSTNLSAPCSVAREKRL